MLHFFLFLQGPVDPWTPPAAGPLDPLLFTVCYVFPAKRQAKRAVCKKIDTVHIASQSREIVFKIKISNMIKIHLCSLKSVRSKNCSIV
jgi:hypothetical protein